MLHDDRPKDPIPFFQDNKLTVLRLATGAEHSVVLAKYMNENPKVYTFGLNAQVYSPLFNNFSLMTKFSCFDNHN